MKFLKAAASAQFSDFAQEGAYLDVQAAGALLQRLKDAVSHQQKEMQQETHAKLQAFLKAGFPRIMKWVEDKLSEIVSVCQGQLKTCSEEGSYRPEDVRIAADSINHELLRFQEVRSLNEDIVRHIVRSHDKSSLLSLEQCVKDLFEAHPFHKVALDEVYILMSSLYTAVRRDKNKSAKAAGPVGAVGSQTFDRRSIKYWVHHQDLPFVICRVLPFLPVNIGGQNSTEATKYIGQKISSVYFDNRQFLFYHRRMERLEGSTLIRIRWYTPPDKDSSELKDDANVFVEQKVHHEAWSGERSTKRRFVISNNNVDRFVSGQMSLDPAIESLRRQGTPEKEITKFKQLSQEVLYKFQAYNLEPVMRSAYVRSAFQNGEDASVRVSIDTDLKMYGEDTAACGTHWRCKDISTLPRVDFPYSVVEVKLQFAENEVIPAWVEELMTCKEMEAVPKYSKYAHGIFANYGHRSAIKLEPYWSHQDTAEIRAASKYHNWGAMLGLTDTCWKNATDKFIFGDNAPQNPKAGGGRYKFLPGLHLTGHYATLCGKTSPDIHPLSSRAEASLNKRALAYQAYNIFDYLEQTREVTCCVLLSAPPANKLPHDIPWQTGKRVKVPQKFDPKTLMTSERNFLVWVSHGTKSALLGLGMIHLSASKYNWQTNPVAICGLCFVIGGVILMAYALLLLNSRSLRIYAKVRKVRYDDLRGPMGMAVLMSAAIVATGYVMLHARVASLFVK